MSASLPEPVLALLRGAGLVSRNETPSFKVLSGGVSSEIWRVELPATSICVKRALPRLRVAQRWEAPVERNRYERMWLETAAAAAPGAAPRVLAYDDAGGLFAMECLDAPVWKERLRQGDADPRFAARVGATLAAIHKASAGHPDTARSFATDAIFYAIRLEPYLVFTGQVHRDLEERFTFLVNRTAATKVCLVHGDVSPKNILVGGEGPAHFPIFLDAECAWYGDPAFDLAFCLNHLLLKCLWVPHKLARFLACFDALASNYLQEVTFSGVERRAASLLPALLLARVDGKSPVEYLSDDNKRLVRRVARELLVSQPPLPELAEAWRKSLT